MNARIRVRAFTVAAGLLTACSGVRSGMNPQQLRDADLAFARATAERGLEGFRSFLAEDVMTIRPDIPVVKGAGAVAERWAPLLNDRSQSITWQPVEAVISPAGDMGFTVGTYEIRRSGGGASGAVRTGKYVTIWKREAGGRWRVAYDSGVQDAAPDVPHPN